MTTQENFNGEHLLNAATNTLRQQREGAGKLLSNGQPIIVDFEHQQGGITHNLTLSLTKKKRVIQPAVPVFLPTESTPPANSAQKKRESKGVLAFLLFPGLMLLLLISGIAASLSSPAPVVTKRTSIQVQTQATPTQLCSQTEDTLSTVFGAPTTNHLTPYGQCALYITGNFTVPTSNQLAQQLIIPPTAMSAIIQRGFGGLYIQRAEVLEITNVHPGPYTDVTFAQEKALRTSILLINPTVSIADLKLLCPRLMSTYEGLLQKGDMRPSGCYLYPDDH